MKKTTLFLAALTLLLSCKKEEAKRYSEWYVNGERFYTNNVREDVGNAVSSFEGNDFQNRFALDFNLRSFPTSGQYEIDCSRSNQGLTCLAITYKGVGYLPPKNTYIKAGSIGGRGSYTLDSTWFYNESNSQDVVLIKGTFNRP